MNRAASYIPGVTVLSELVGDGLLNSAVLVPVCDVRLHDTRMLPTIIIALKYPALTAGAPAERPAHNLRGVGRGQFGFGPMGVG